MLKPQPNGGLRPDVRAIFGDPVPEALVELAKAVHYAIIKAVDEVPEVKQLKRKLIEAHESMDRIREEKAAAIFLHPRNLGGHYYPGIGPTGLTHTSNCNYCGCWCGGSRSGGPDGINPLGSCPGNPRLRDAYELLKAGDQPPPPTHGVENV